MPSRKSYSETRKLVDLKPGNIIEVLRSTTNQWVRGTIVSNADGLEVDVVTQANEILYRVPVSKIRIT